MIDESKVKPIETVNEIVHALRDVKNDRIRSRNMISIILMLMTQHKLSFEDIGFKDHWDFFLMLCESDKNNP